MYLLSLVPFLVSSLFVKKILDVLGNSLTGEANFWNPTFCFNL